MYSVQTQIEPDSREFVSLKNTIHYGDTNRSQTRTIPYYCRVM